MSAITFDDGQITVDADLVAKGLNLTPEALRESLRNGTVTSLCEKGEGADAGRYRLTFYSTTRRLRVFVDAQGVVLQTSTADFVRKPPPG